TGHHDCMSLTRIEMPIGVGRMVTREDSACFFFFKQKTAYEILNTTPVAGGGNTSISVWKQYSSACGPVQVSNNIASALDTSGNPNSYWDGGGCAPVTLTNNVFDAAAAALLQPVSTNLPPPPIPPQPFACAVVSPYTNNTSLPSCGGSSSGPPSPPTLLTATVH